MTLEYRCSKCGALLETTNANPLQLQRLENNKLRAIRAQVAATRQLFDEHVPLPVPVEIFAHKMCLEKLEFLLAEIDRLNAVIEQNAGLYQAEFEKQRNERS